MKLSAKPANDALPVNIVEEIEAEIMAFKEGKISLAQFKEIAGLRSTQIKAVQERIKEDQRAFRRVMVGEVRKREGEGKVTR